MSPRLPVTLSAACRGPPLHSVNGPCQPWNFRLRCYKTCFDLWPFASPTKAKSRATIEKKLRGTLNTQTQRYALKTECHPRHHVQNSEDRDKYINDKARKCHAGDCTLVSSSCGQPQGAQGELHPDVRAPTHGWMVSVAMYAGGMK